MDTENFTYEFLPARGISKETYKFFNVLTKIDADGKPISKGFPYADGNCKVRRLDRKHFYWTEKGAHKGGLFGRNLYDPGSHECVIITEGEEDACSFHEVLWSRYKVPVVSAQSSSSALADCSMDYDFLNSFRRIVLAFDNDRPGKDAASEVAKLFDFNKIYQVKFNKFKDANDYLQHGESETLLNLYLNAKRYQPEDIVSDLASFKELLTKKREPGVPYPFPTLTEMTYGMKRGEIILLTALEGVGKTELMHAFEYQLLKETDNAIGTIFLEEPDEHHLQKLAGQVLKAPVHLPDDPHTEDEVYAAIEGLVKTDQRLHVCSLHGSIDPAVFLDKIRYLVSANLCTHILVDHISMVVSGLGGEDERRTLDYICTELEVLVKELNFCLIIVSHVNDEGQTRGSRYIGKIAHTRIDAYRNVEDSDPQERYRIYLKISKNRFCHKTGPAGIIVFDPITYVLSELTP